MDFYINIQILPNSEYSDNILISEVFFRLHKALVEVGQGEVGVSFPKFNKTLGGCLRLHGSRLLLQRVMSTGWSKTIEDYVVISDISQVSEVTGYRVVKRVQVKSSIERLMRRSVRKGWLSEEEAKKRIEAEEAKTTLLPYVRLKSHSTGQQFCLFVDHGPIVPKPAAGQFTAYGLSATATIPWF